jgi:hypothetical protein
MALKVSTMRTIRQWHLYVGLFFAPLLLLFSISGAIQTFRLPDPPTAPGWMKWMAAIHKDQELPRTKPPKLADKAAAKPAGSAQFEKKPNKLPLQILVTLLAIGLIVSTLLGVTIALNSRATRRVSLILLAAGSSVPLALLYL